MTKRLPSKSIKWLSEAIATLPSDDSVPKGTQGYNAYRTQKEHWLGWLNPSAGKGTYPRQDDSNRDARDVYNRIVEPKMLIWLATAAQVDSSLLSAAISSASATEKLPSKSAAIRKHIPWPGVEADIALQMSNNAA